MSDQMTNQSAEHLIRRMLNAYHFNEDTTESLIADMVLVFNKLNDIPSTEPQDTTTQEAVQMLLEVEVKQRDAKRLHSYLLNHDYEGMVPEETSFVFNPLAWNDYDCAMLSRSIGTTSSHFALSQEELRQIASLVLREEIERLRDAKEHATNDVALDEDEDDLGDLREHPF